MVNIFVSLIMMHRGTLVAKPKRFYNALATIELPILEQSKGTNRRQLNNCLASLDFFFFFF